MPSRYPKVHGSRVPPHGPASRPWCCRAPLRESADGCWPPAGRPSAPAGPGRRCPGLRSGRPAGPSARRGRWCRTVRLLRARPPAGAPSRPGWRPSGPCPACALPSRGRPRPGSRWLPPTGPVRAGRAGRRRGRTRWPPGPSRHPSQREPARGCGRPGRQVGRHGCLLRLGALGPDLGRTCRQPGRAAAASDPPRVVGQLRVDQAGDQRDVQVEVLLPCHAVSRRAGPA